MGKKSSFELSVDLTKSLIWPLFAFVLLVSFWAPINNILKKIPSIIDRSESITIAGLSLKIEQGLNVRPTDTVKKVLSKISADGVKKLMNKKNSSYYDSKVWPKRENEELFRLKLIEEIPKKELNQHEFGIRSTLLGKECQKFLDVIMVGIVKQLAR